MHTVALGTGKGGVGKTTIAANLAAEAAHRGLKTLLVDTDPQSDCALLLGVEDHDDGWGQLAMLKGQRWQPLRDVRPGLDLLAGGASTELVADALARAEVKAGPEGLAVLGEVWGEELADYDLVVVDTPPARQSRPLLDAVLLGADWLVIPTRTDLKSIRAIRVLGERLRRLAGQGLGVSRIAGVVLFGVGAQATAITADTRQFLEEVLGPVRVFEATIRYAEKADRDQGIDRQTVREYAGQADDRAGESAPWRLGAQARSYSTAAGRLLADYQDLTGEVLATIVDGEAR